MNYDIEKCIDSLEHYRIGSSVERMHITRTIKSNTVGHHTANAMAIAFTLAVLNQMTVESTNRIVMHLLTHDTPEGYTGDMPGNVKSGSSVLRNELNDLESDWIRDVFGGTPLRHTTYPDLAKTEIEIVKMADALDLMWQCVDELEMGNRKVERVYMNIIRPIAAHLGGDLVLKGVREIHNHLAMRWVRLFNLQRGEV